MHFAFLLVALAGYMKDGRVLCGIACLGVLCVWFAVLTCSSGRSRGTWDCVCSTLFSFLRDDLFGTLACYLGLCL